MRGQKRHLRYDRRRRTGPQVGAGVGLWFLVGALLRLLATSVRTATFDTPFFCPGDLHAAKRQAAGQPTRGDAATSGSSVHEFNAWANFPGGNDFAEVSGP